VYPPPVFTPPEMAALRLEAQRVLGAERTARGLGDGQAAAPVGLAGTLVAGTLYWVAAERCRGIKFGDVVQHVGAVQVDGAKAVHVLPDGSSIFVQCVDGGHHKKFLQKAADNDPRIVGQEYDALGKPDCSLKDVSSKFEEVSTEWNLTGPRTSRWCISYLVVEGLGFERHHERFRQLCKIESSAWGVQEHYQLSMIAKHALQTDQLDGYNNLCLEVVFRRIQTIEYAYAERAREIESKAVGGRLSLEEQSTFGGITRQASTLMICPQLLDHVNAEVERDANLAKNLRKAREERERVGPQGALKMLRAANGYGEDQPVGSLASFNIEAVSMLEVGWVPIDLGTLWGSDGQQKVNDFVSHQVLPPEKAKVKLEACGVRAPYSDPLLRQGRVYRQFLRKLHDSHLIDYSLSPGKERIAFFCVTKKSGKLRLIVDARRSNAHFEEHSHVSLTTGDGLGALEFEKEAQVTLAQADLKDAFYHLAMPVQLRDYFTLTPVKARDVGVTTIDGRHVDPWVRLTPRLAAVAMGWTWALHLCQSIHESLAEKVHEEECEKGGKVLGWELTTDALFMPSRSRAWKVRKSLKKEAGTTRPVACKPIQQEEMRLANTATSRSAKKKMRAVNRMDVRPDPLEGMTSLQLASVSKECLSRYKRCWSSVKQKLLTCKGKLKATTTVDTILSRELDNLYHDGEDVSAGEYLIAAVVFFNICLKSPAMQKLPQVKQSLKGWRKMAPQRSRLPVPWEVTSLLIQKPIDKGLMGLALHMGLMFALYLRPSEGLRLSARDVVPPVLKGQGNYRHWTVVLRPEGAGVASKTGVRRITAVRPQLSSGLRRGSQKILQQRSVEQEPVDFQSRQRRSEPFSSGSIHTGSDMAELPTILWEILEI
ncbi:unnamed protein product, partial [Durusdinium trenchii]